MYLSTRSHWIFACLILMVCSCKPSSYIRNIDNDFFRYQTGQPARISAHRGGGNYAGYPENCIASFDWLANQMPVIIECDISMTSDSVLIMMHDDTYNRTTNGSGNVKDSTYAYSRTLYLKDNKGTMTPYKVPTLDEVLKWGQNKVAFTLDVKRGVPFEKVIALIKKHSAEKYAAVITYNAKDAALVHLLAPELMISVTIRNEEEYERHKALGITDDRMLAFAGTREPNPDWLKTLHSKGIMCILGTLGNLDKMAEARGDNLYLKWYEAGADIMSTDRPVEAWKALKR